ncbi:MAG TPA: hypothetical protein VEX36_05135 [Thermoleophilaceae bacterium]|nr:hypothetical protein [Thermoleophilaceae bacterium]
MTTATTQTAPWRASSRWGLLTRALALSAALAVCLLTVCTASADAAAPAHGRAWELVTPPDPSGNNPANTLAIDADGDRIVYATQGPVPGVVAGARATTSIAVRGPAGWSSTPVTYPYSVSTLTLQPPLPVGASRDLSTWIWASAWPLLPGAPGGYDTSSLYRGSPGGPLTLLGVYGDVAFVDFLGVSDDAQHVLFETVSLLLPKDTRTQWVGQLYEYVGTTLRLVAVDAGGELLSPCGSTAGAAAEFPPLVNLPPNPLSRDGRRIFFTSPASACGDSVARAYLRENGVTTTEISASRCTRPDCNAPADAIFTGATPDGSTAFIATTQQLTNDDVDDSRDLYRYDVAAATLSRVSVGAPAAAADVIPIRVMPSHDGRRVYFLASGVLVHGRGTTGMPNLYVGGDDGVRFVGTLATNDDWVGYARQEVAVSPGAGGRIMFVTAAALTADDTDLSRDVYLYDDAETRLVRVSGAPGSGNGPFDAEASLPDDIAVSVRPFPTDTPSSLSEDGRRVFFSTAEALLPDDANSAVDVYEWVDGSLGLVSAGAGADGATLVGASADGSTAFVATTASLLPGDDDRGDLDLYAARLGGGFPEPEASPLPDCGNACLAPAERPSRPDPASLTHVERRSATRLGVRPPGPAALRRMSRSGRLTLVVLAPRAGRVTARATARVGRRLRTVAHSRARAGRAGRLALRLRLSAVARRRLAQGGSLDLRVVLRHSRLDRATVVRFALEGAK